MSSLTEFGVLCCDAFSTLQHRFLTIKILFFSFDNYFVEFSNRFYTFFWIINFNYYRTQCECSRRKTSAFYIYFPWNIFHSYGSNLLMYILVGDVLSEHLRKKSRGRTSYSYGHYVDIYNYVKGESQMKLKSTILPYICVAHMLPVEHTR